MNTEGLFPASTKTEHLARNFDQMTRLPEANVHEVRAELVKGIENVWYEYVPGSYTGEKPVPLVVQLHGGGCDGRIWTHVTAWHLLAEQEGFIVVYPNSIVPARWCCDERDIAYLYSLIAHLKGKYKIDGSRVFMQGMSNGEMMTLAFTMVHPEVLAAAGNITGPSPAEMIGEERPAGALPLIQMRGEKDVFFKLPDPPPEDLYAKRYSMNDLNREIWEAVNGIEGLPVLDVRGKDNFLRYRGRNAPIINWEIKGCGHREPPDSAQVLWDYLYSACSREAGKLMITKPNKILMGDADTAAIAVGSNYAYKVDHLELLHQSPDGYVRVVEPASGKNVINEMFETAGLYMPVEGLAALFGAKVEMVDPGDSAVAVFPDGTRYEFLASSLLLKVNGEHRGLRKPCMLMSGFFLIPIEEFAGDVLSKFVSVEDGVMLISSHYAELGRYTARVLKKLMV